jgi:drug/metabolite transporter (DMT)-like permease
MSVNPPPGPPTDRILRAILSTVVAMACFAVLNAMSKTLSTSGYPVIEVIWSRYFFAFLFMLAMFLPRSGRKLFSIRRLDTQVVRGLLLFFSSYLFFHGVVYLPLATAAAISLSSPIIVTALSARLLERAGRPAALGGGGRRLHRRADRGAAGPRGFDWHVLLIVASTVCSSFYQLFSRRYGQSERPDASATLATIVGTVAATPFVPFEWVTPTSTWHCGAVRRHGHHGRHRPLLPHHRLQPGAGRRGDAVQLHPADRLGDPGLRRVPRIARSLDLGRRRRDHRLRPLHRLPRARRHRGKA